MLRYVFPSTPKGAAKYGGGMIGENTFFKIFKSNDEDFEPAFNRINIFLEANGYSAIESSEFDLIEGYSDEHISLSLSAYQPELILYIDRDSSSYTQSAYLTYLLKESKIQINLNDIKNKEEAE